MRVSYGKTVSLQRACLYDNVPQRKQKNMDILLLPHNEAIKSSSSTRGTSLKMSTYRRFIYSCVHFSVRVRVRESLRRSQGGPRWAGTLARTRSAAPPGTFVPKPLLVFQDVESDFPDRSSGAGRGYLQVRNPSMFQDVRRVCDRAPRPRGCSGCSCAVLPSGATRTDGSLRVRDETDLSRPCSLGQRSP